MTQHDTTHASEPLTADEAARLAVETRVYADNILKALAAQKSPTATDLIVRDIAAVCLWQQTQLDAALAEISALRAANRAREGDI